MFDSPIVKGDNSTYRPKAGEKCWISPPLCDNASGYVFEEFEVLWTDETYIIYRKRGCWPNVNQWRHLICKPLSTTVVIWTDEHQAWWREKGLGLTTERAEAALWSLEDAQKVTRLCTDIKFQPVELMDAAVAETNFEDVKQARDLLNRLADERKIAVRLLPYPTTSPLEVVRLVQRVEYDEEVLPWPSSTRSRPSAFGRSSRRASRPSVMMAATNASWRRLPVVTPWSPGSPIGFAVATRTAARPIGGRSIGSSGSPPHLAAT